MAEQNFKNHGRYVPGFHFLTVGLLTVNLIHAIRGLSPFTMQGLYAAILALGVMLVAWYARAFAVAVQDRVIRLEERLRVRELAPQSAARFDALPIAQVTALRFASDGELPGLLQQVLDGKLANPKDIKAAVQHWRPDLQRA